MIYREARPSAAVREFVSCYWFLKDDAPAPGIQRIVPDGRPELILNFAQPFASQANGRWDVQPQFFLMGQITGPLLLRPTGPTHAIGIRFHPQGAHQLMRLPMCEIAGSPVRLEDFSPALRRQLETLTDLHSPAEQFAALDRVLLRLVSKVQARDFALCHAVNRFEISGGLADVESVASSAGISTRQMQRRFQNAVGLSPKVFSRMQRFQRIFRRLERSDTNWAEAAVLCGYYDQSHLIRDFREFSGTTPAALLAEEVDLARRFSGSQSVSHFSKTPSHGNF